MDYDEMGRVTSIAHSHLNTPITTYSRTWDLADRLTQAVDPEGTTSYAYDDRDQLTGADHPASPDESYAYDDNGNRTGGGYQVGADNRLVSDGTYTFTYDAEGNRLTQTEIASGKLTQYEWDYRNRLIRVVRRNTAIGPITAEMLYTYDSLDRRVSKSVDADGAGAGVAAVEVYVYDQNHIALSFNGLGTR